MTYVILMGEIPQIPNLNRSRLMSRNLANVDLNLLVALDALLSEQNVTRAAERLMIGQSAMSSTLRRLRSLFSDQLLVREGRTLVPTPLALSLVTPVREALDIIQSALAQQNTFDPAVDSRVFTICTSDYVTLTMLRPLITRLHSVAPHVKIHIVPLGVDDYTEDLRRQQVDLLIVPPEILPDHAAYRSQEMFTDTYLVAADAAHPDLRENITLEQFKSLPYVTYRSGRNTALVDQQLDRLGIPRSVEVTADSFVVAPHLIAGTEMIMLIHRQLGENLAPLLGLQLLEPPFPLQPTRQVMYWNTSLEDVASHQWMRQQLIAIASEATGSPTPETLQ